MFLINVVILFMSFSRLYSYEVDKSCEMNENLGAGIAVFQGLSNIALNCECVLPTLTNQHNVKQTAVMSQDFSHCNVFTLCANDPGIVLGTIFAGGTLISRNEMTPGELMSFLIASQTVQR